jgi:hypothetical protein
MANNQKKSVPRGYLTNLARRECLRQGSGSESANVTVTGPRPAAPAMQTLAGAENGEVIDLGYEGIAR